MEVEEAEWTELLQSSSADPLFNSYAWQNVWRQTYDELIDNHHILTVRSDEGSLVALLAVFSVGRKIMNIVRSNALVIGGGGAARAVVEALDQCVDGSIPALSPGCIFAGQDRQCGGATWIALQLDGAIDQIRGRGPGMACGCGPGECASFPPYRNGYQCMRPSLCRRA